MFYISTQGHSASGWFSKVLNMHPEIVCWHGTRSIPPFIGREVEILSPEKFVKGLLECQKNVKETKQFGSIHGFCGAIIKDHVENNNGKFFAIYRNPLSRVNSIFSSFLTEYASSGNIVASGTKVEYENFLSQNKDVINEYFKKYKKNQHIIRQGKKIFKKIKIFPLAKTIYKNLFIYLKVFKKKKFTMEHGNEFSFDAISYDKKINAIIDVYVHACYRTFDTDSEIADACSFDQIIKMEDIVMSQNYFKDFFYKITGLVASQEYLDKVFASDDHINIHSNTKNLEKIIENWPSCFKNDFMERLNNSSAKKFYDKLGYFKELENIIT